MICVTDANIWIDLDNASLSDKAFQLDCVWIIPDLVFAELERPNRASLLKYGLRKQSLSGAEMEAMLKLTERYLRPSRADLSALYIAQLEKAVLVTGDGALRDAATNEEIEVHGILWLLESLIADGILSKVRASRALQTIVDEGSRLPEGEVNRRLKRWDS